MGLCANYVDDTLHAGTKEYAKLCNKTEEKFKCKEIEWDNVQFAGVEVETKKNGFEVHQKKYINKIRELDYKSTYEDFRSLRAKLAWTNNSRPDIACAVALLTQVTKEVLDTDKNLLRKLTLLSRTFMSTPILFSSIPSWIKIRSSYLFTPMHRLQQIET